MFMTILQDAKHIINAILIILFTFIRFSALAVERWDEMWCGEMWDVRWDVLLQVWGELNDGEIFCSQCVTQKRCEESTLATFATEKGVTYYLRRGFRRRLRNYRLEKRDSSISGETNLFRRLWGDIAPNNWKRNSRSFLHAWLPMNMWNKLKMAKVVEGGLRRAKEG